MDTISLMRELNSPTKIKVLCWVLQNKRVTISELVELTSLNRTNLSKQVCELHRATVLTRKKAGKNNYYYLNPQINDYFLMVIKTAVNAYHLVDLHQGENYEPY